MNNKIKVSIKANISHLNSRERELLAVLKKVVLLVNPLYQEQKNKGSYPADLTVEEFESYVQANPNQKAALESPFTNIVRDGEALKAIPYSEVYKEHLEKIAAVLIHASELSDNEPFKYFLKMRASSFLTNDYHPTDIQWVHLLNTPLELTIGPLEEYDDTLLGIKRSFEAILGIAIPEENQRLKMYQELARDYDASLAREFGYNPSGGNTPMVIIDEVSAGGYSADRYIPTAFNLPNDIFIRQSVGSKQVFIRNVMSGRFSITKQIAERIAVRYIERMDPEKMLQFVIGHELSHGLGVSMKNGLKDLASTLEEAKADVLGVMFMYYIEKIGKLPAGTAEDIAISHCIDSIRQIYRDSEGAHGFGAVMQLNWLIAKNALALNNGEMVFNLELLSPALHELGQQLIRLGTGGDYNKAKEFVTKWGDKIPGISEVIKKIADVPTDLEPVFE
ncbi:MAG: hypothetical protein JWO40_847 [Candidatus Doudnabacteria bacterium]|nr:hypothetical protein [Candidatus Doudnabacteria bacterium]